MIRRLVIGELIGRRQGRELLGNHRVALLVALRSYVERQLMKERCLTDGLDSPNCMI